VEVELRRKHGSHGDEDICESLAVVESENVVGAGIVGWGCKVGGIGMD